MDERKVDPLADVGSVDWGKAPADKPRQAPVCVGVCDLLILGAGPAGMTAGVYAARKQLTTMIVTEDVGGQTSWSSGIENYLGYVYITGPELVAKFEEHLKSFDLTLEFGKVGSVTREDGLFVVRTEAKEYRSRAMILATGKSPRMLNVPGEAEFRGRGVSYCPTCDAPLFAGAEVAVIGGGNSGLDAAIQLMKICPKVYVVEREPKLKCDEVFKDRATAAPNVEIHLETVVTAIRGDVLVNCVEIEHLPTGARQCLPVKGVFVEIGLIPNTSYLDGLLALNEFGEVPVNCAAETEVPGLFAAGDVTNVPEKQIIIAAGMGAAAALRAYDYLIRSG